MLKSIEFVRQKAGLPEDGKRQLSRMPGLEELCRVLEYPDTLYMSVGRIGSHAVHGTWPDLLFNYLEEDERGELVITDNILSIPRSNHLLGSVLLVADAMRDAVGVFIQNKATSRALVTHLRAVQKGILKADSLGRQKDFEPED